MLNAPDRPRRHVLDNIMEKSRDNQLVILDAKIIDEDKCNRAQMLKVSVSAFACSAAERILCKIICALNLLIARIERREKPGNTPKKRFAILGSRQKRHFFHGTSPAFLPKPYHIFVFSQANKFTLENLTYRTATRAVECTVQEK